MFLVRNPKIRKEDDTILSMLLWDRSRQISFIIKLYYNCRERRDGRLETKFQWCEIVVNRQYIIINILHQFTSILHQFYSNISIVNKNVKDKRTQNRALRNFSV